MKVTQEQRIEIVTKIVTGLLATGHYTAIDENNGAPYLRFNSESKCYYIEDHAIEVLDAIECAVDLCEDFCEAAVGESEKR